MSGVDVKTLLKDLRTLEAKAWDVANFYADGDQGLMFDAIDEANTLSNAIQIIEGDTMSWRVRRFIIIGGCAIPPLGLIFVALWAGTQ